MKKFQIVLFALLRLDHRMVFFRFRRLLRNRLVPVAPNLYMRWLSRHTESLPSAFNPSEDSLETSEFVSRFYTSEEGSRTNAAIGRFEHLGVLVDFGGFEKIEWTRKLPEEHSNILWSMTLCHAEFCHDIIMDQKPELALKLLRKLFEDVPISNPRAFDTVWSPYVASHRLLSTLSALIRQYLAGGLQPEEAASLFTICRQDASYVWKNIEHELLNNHTERNLAALCLFHMSVQSISPSKSRKLDRFVRRVLDKTFTEDGMQAERSAMYQGLSIMSLRIFTQSYFLSEDTRRKAGSLFEKAKAAWSFLTHEDGEIALFNDSWIEPSRSIKRILGGVLSHQNSLEHAGFQKTVSGNFSVILDSGPIGIPWNPGHGHSDFLSVEMDVSGHRLIVDPGTSTYSSGAIRDYERSAAAHNGPRIQGVEPITYAGSFLVGRLVSSEISYRALEGERRNSTIAGRMAIGNVKTHREVSPNAQGDLRIIDRWNDSLVHGVSGFLFPCEWDLRVIDVDQIRLKFDNSTVYVKVVKGELESIRLNYYSSRYLKRKTANEVTFTPRREKCGLTLELAFSESPLS